MNRIDLSIKLDPASVVRLIAALRTQQRARRAVGERANSTICLQIKLLRTIRRIDLLVAEYHRERAACPSRKPRSRQVSGGRTKGGH